MPAPLIPILAGAAGSALLGKLIDAVMSNVGSSQSSNGGVIDDRGSSGGAGQVYDTPQQASSGGKTLAVIHSPNEVQSNADIGEATNILRDLEARAASNVPERVASRGVPLPVARPDQAQVAPGQEDSADSHIGVAELLGALGAGGLGYAALRGRGRGTTSADPINLDEALGVPPTTQRGVPAKANDPKIVDAEYTEVKELPKSGEQKKLTGPNDVAGRIEGQAEAPKQIDKRGGMIEDHSPIHLGDATSGPTVVTPPPYNAATAKKVVLPNGTVLQIQDGEHMFDASGKYLGRATQRIPQNAQGVLRTLGVLRRAVR